jgi:hypothetical protein
MTNPPGKPAMKKAASINTCRDMDAGKSAPQSRSGRRFTEVSTALPHHVFTVADEGCPMCRSIDKTVAAMAGCLLLLLSMHARAGDPPAARGGSDASTCVDVTINGHPVLAYDCLNQRLASQAAAAGAATPAPDSSAVARLPSNQQVGQFNFSAFSHRMGSNLGKSAVPQRPPTLSGSTAPLLSAPVSGH